MMQLAGEDEIRMKIAIEQARLALAANEVPVGAIVVKEGRIIGKGYNRVIETADPTAHAEIVAMRQAGEVLKNYRLTNCLLYVTLEPCAMCVAAASQARIAAIIYALPEPKTGAIISQGCLADTQMLGWKPLHRSGVCKDEVAKMMRDFFGTKRSNQAKQ